MRCTLLPNGASAKPSALVIAPEAPYPMHGGGALRTASLIEYLRERYIVDIVFFYEERPIPAPVGHFRHVLQIPLPYQSRKLLPWLVRNARRQLRGVPPLIDRFGGFAAQIAAWLADRQYDLALAEHFWVAPYVDLLKQHARKVICDLHNIESELLRPVPGLFAAYSLNLERKLLPKFDSILVTSEEDAKRIRVPSVVYPNAVPLRPPPNRSEDFAIGMSGNFEYPPNLLGVRWFATEIWPILKQRHPDLEWRLIGKNVDSVARWSKSDPRICAIGSVDDAVAELARCRAAVVPIRFGSGTRLKILEAWSAGTPVVSTTKGCEGLGVKNGEEIAIADGFMQFADAVSRILTVEATSAKLSAAARILLEEEFVWPRAWERLEISRALY